jgi:hypothetical protein
VIVDVCDVLGRTIKTLMHKGLTPGSYNVEFDGTSFSSGVYYCRLMAGDVVQTRMIVLMK